MFDQNILTFNPGWDQDAARVDPFTDGNPELVDQHV